MAACASIGVLADKATSCACAPTTGRSRTGGSKPLRGASGLGLASFLPYLRRPASRQDLTAHLRQTAARASKFRTVESCHSPPRAVRTPRSLRAFAIARAVVAPVA